MVSEWFMSMTLVHELVLLALIYVTLYAIKRECNIPVMTLVLLVLFNAAIMTCPFAYTWMNNMNRVMKWW